jgi:hypothetical protein
MDSFILIFIIVIVVFYMLIYFDEKNNELKKVKSTVDGREYLVRGDLEDNIQAANLLAEVRKKMVELSDYLQVKHPKDARVIKLKKFSPDNIVEKTKDSKYTSYSINKGEKIVFCLRSRNSDEKLVNLNLLMFVALHELGHVITVSIGHEEEFWDNFKWLLEQSIVLGIYKPHDFRKKPEEYCGTQITDTPLNND